MVGKAVANIPRSTVHSILISRYKNYHYTSRESSLRVTLRVVVLFYTCTLVMKHIANVRLGANNCSESFTSSPDGTFYIQKSRWSMLCYRTRDARHSDHFHLPADKREGTASPTCRLASKRRQKIPGIASAKDLVLSLCIFQEAPSLEKQGYYVSMPQIGS